MHRRQKVSIDEVAGSSPVSMSVVKGAQMTILLYLTLGAIGAAGLALGALTLAAWCLRVDDPGPCGLDPLEEDWKRFEGGMEEDETERARRLV